MLIVGAGGLGSPVALYLAAAGVGTLGIIDDDTVSLDNLQRQVVHGTADVGRPKVESAKDAVARLNPHVAVVTYPKRLVAANAMDIIGAYDLVADGSDNFKTRYLVNDACYFAKKPLVFGALWPLRRAPDDVSGLRDRRNRHAPPELSMPVSRSPARRPRPQLLGGSAYSAQLPGSSGR